MTEVLEGIHGLHSKWCGLSKLLCLYYWDGSVSFFFSWWFEVVRVVQLLLNKILQIKKKNQLLVCRIQTGLVSFKKSLLAAGRTPSPSTSPIPGFLPTATWHPKVFTIIAPSERSEADRYSLFEELVWVCVCVCVSSLFLKKRPQVRMHLSQHLQDERR